MLRLGRMTDTQIVTFENPNFEIRCEHKAKVH